MLIVSTAAKSTTSRARIRTDLALLDYSLSRQLLTRCAYVRRAEASGEARRESDREVHDVSRISNTREGNRPGKGNVTHAVKGARPHVQENQATSWGSFAGKPLIRRPAASATGGAQRAVNKQGGSTSPKGATRTSRPAPVNLGNGKWGTFFSQQVQGPANDPKAMRTRRPRAVKKARPRYAAVPGWRLAHLPAEEIARKWGAYYLPGTPKPSEGRRLVKDPSITRNVERPATAAAAAAAPKPPSLPDDDPSNKAKAKGSCVKAAAAAPAPKSPSLSEDNPLNEAKVSSVKATAPSSPSKPPKAPGYQTWGTFYQQGCASALILDKEDGEKPRAQDRPTKSGSRKRPAVLEEMNRHFRKTKLPRLRKISSPRPSDDKSLWAPEEYVHDWPFWLQMLLGRLGTRSVKRGVCSLCLQYNTGMTGHHAVPKQVAGSFPGRFTREQRGRILRLCHLCHMVIHYVFPNEVLAMKYNSVDRIASDPLIKSWLFFVERHSIDDIHQLMQTPSHTEHERRLAFTELRDLMAIAETALEQMWTQAGFSGRSLLDSYDPQGLRWALRHNGTPSRVFVEHIRLAMKKRPEWAGWYYHVFGTDRRRYRR